METKHWFLLALLPLSYAHFITYIYVILYKPDVSPLVVVAEEKELDVVVVLVRVNLVVLYE